MKGYTRLARGTQLGVLACCLVLAGCGVNLKDGYDKVEKGMTRDEVRSLLGKNWGIFAELNVAGSVIQVVDWEDAQNVVRVDFENNKVTKKSITPK